ncbi:MAG: hypothetical protein EOO15_14290 [Chitinophagaceae bacterium]|nr:MAG: hypothetical protein EOO15_14290 [Chitinophagaceae bacterium]
MKTVTRLAALLCAPIIFSCGREALHQNDSPVPYLTTGQWKVSECTGPSVPNNTVASYDIKFNGDGALTCRYNGTSLTGTWSVHQKVEGRALNIRLNSAPSDASVLANEWDLQYSDPTVVRLTQGNMHLSLGRP